MDLRAKSQVVVFVLVLFVIVVSRTAPVQVDHTSCAHALRIAQVQGNKSTSSSSVRSIKSIILSTLSKIQLQNRMNNFTETSRPSSARLKLEGVELVLFQKLLKDIGDVEATPSQQERLTDNKGAPVPCDKLCRRRRRHNRRQKESIVLKPPRTDPGILKSNNPPVVITKDSHILRKDWCKTERLEQQIREPGCRPKTIVNNFCYGQCNSFFIPNGEVSDDPGRRGSNSTVPDFKSCAVCKPRLTSWTKVTLRCPGMIPATRTKRVLRVHKCRCQTEVSR